jgi:endonuclease/exonuclease/phosphatase family metal-dependent hydrolase
MGLGSALSGYPWRNSVAAPTFSILTLNLGLLALRPLGFWQIPVDSYVNERLAAAPGHLQRLDPDIIALQEVYAASHCRHLAQCLRNSHPFVFAPRRRGSILGSGLMVLSRFPARGGEFVPMRRGRRFRHFARETGCLYVEIDLPGFGSLSVTNTHVTAEHADAHDHGSNDVTDFAEIDHALAVANQHGRSSGLLVGDFNCSEVISAEKYQRIVATGYCDAFASTVSHEVLANAATWDAANPLNRKGRFQDAPSQRIDHVFVHNAIVEKVRPISSSIEFTGLTVRTDEKQLTPLSDHFGTLVKMTLAGRGAR